MKQQDLIRGAMLKDGKTRDAFCKERRIARRRLDCWLLPDKSSGFRRAPQAFLEQLQRDMLAYSTGVLVQPGQVLTGDGLDVVCEEIIPSVVFPRAWRHTINGPSYDWMTGSAIPDTLHSFTEDSFHPTPSFSLLPGQEVSSQELTLATLADGDARWVRVVRHSSQDAAWGYLAALLDLNPDFEEGGNQSSIGCFGGEFFTLLSIPAPTWHNKSLLIFSTEILSFDITDCTGVGRDVWVLVIDADGNRTTRLPNKRETVLSAEASGSDQVGFFAKELAERARENILEKTKG